MPPAPRKRSATTAKAPLKNAVLHAQLADVKYAKIKVADGFRDLFQTDLEELLDLPATLSARATRAHDGRQVKLVLVTVHDRTGHSRPGIPLQLLDAKGTVVDRSFTSRTGLAILRFPETGEAHAHRGGAAAQPAPTKGTVRILDGSANGIANAVEIPAGSQFADLTLMLQTLPALPVATAADAVNDTGLWPPPGLGDDPFTNLPPDFTPELCDAIAAKVGDERDSLLGKLGDADDFRTQKKPLIKRLSVVRNGVSVDGQEPRRYLVRVRQSWIFLGYTLGELAEVDSLDPGSVIDETVGTVERSVEQVSRLVDQARSFASSSMSDVLRQTNRIDTLVQAATSTEVNASVSGWGIGIPGLFGAGSLGVGVGLRTGATTSTNVDTSLNVNHAISTAQSFVNEAIHTATSTLSSLARTVTTSVGRVSPLLSRVTNLLRWRVYENYAVCTHVEDILELKSVPVLAIDETQRPQAGIVTNPVFSPVEIAEYRRFFEPALLEPRLRSEYQSLVDMVRVGPEGRPITHVTVEAEYSANVAQGRLVAEINGVAAELRLRPGSGRAVGVVRFPQPVPASALSRVELRLTATVPGGFLNEIIDHLFTVDITSVSVWAGREPGMPPSDTDPIRLHVDGDTTVAETTMFFTATPTLVDATKNPLWTHVNQNPSYYLGVLAQAALLYPSLRDDSDKLRQIPGEVWRLPIVGFEGNRIIVAKDPEEGNDDVERLLGDRGAATLVQIAAPGAYSEALQGLLSLVDAEGLIHPSLIPVPAPVTPPLQVIDLTGKQLVPAPAGTPVPSPPVVVTP